MTRCTCAHPRDAHYLTPAGAGLAEPCGRCNCERFQETK